MPFKYPFLPIELRNATLFHVETDELLSFLQTTKYFRQYAFLNGPFSQQIDQFDLTFDDEPSNSSDLTRFNFTIINRSGRFHEFSLYDNQVFDKSKKELNNLVNILLKNLNFLSINIAIEKLYLTIKFYERDLLVYRHIYRYIMPDY